MPSYKQEDINTTGRMNPILVISLGVLALLAIILALMFGLPNYNVYRSRLDGQAELARATFSKQAAVQQAIAKEEAAVHEKQAEITRAEGAARAVEITGLKIQQYPDYLRYLYVNNLAESHDQIIYVPTEAGLPLLSEAGRGANLAPKPPVPAK